MNPTLHPDQDITVTGDALEVDSNRQMRRRLAVWLGWPLSLLVVFAVGYAVVDGTGSRRPAGSPVTPVTPVTSPASPAASVSPVPHPTREVSHPLTDKTPPPVAPARAPTTTAAAKAAVTHTPTPTTAAPAASTTTTPSPSPSLIAICLKNICLGKSHR